MSIVFRAATLMSLAGLWGCTDALLCPDAVPISPLPIPDPNRPVYVGTADAFQPGPLAVTLHTVARCADAAPLPMRIYAPTASDDYPVIQLQHAFFAPNDIYDTIAEHVASHGFIVIVPQMYAIGPAVAFGDPTAAEEAERAAAVMDWLPGRLSALTGTVARTDRMGIAGHSRGGKVAWLLLKADPSRVRGVVGIDPVDGTGGPTTRQPRAIDGPLNLPFPTLVIGAGLGGACSPQGDNHEQFYAASAAPAWHVVALDYGHADMCDEDFAALAAAVCPSGATNRDAMRRLTAGLLTAFFRATLQGDSSAFEALSDAVAMPARVMVESR